MFLIENKSHDPAWNLALEEHLFQLAGRNGQSYVMFWRNAPSVIVGRFQNTAEEIDETAVAEAGVRVIRRSTGGGAVYHDLGNLNYSLIVAHDDLAGFDYRSLADPILKTLAGLGVAAELSGRNDLTVGGLKISGTAQQSGPSSVLYHGTLLYDVDLYRLSRMLKVDPAKYESKGVKSIRSRVCNLKPLLAANFLLKDLEAELVRAIKPLPLALSRSDLAAVHEIKTAKYDRWDWNWGRSPEFTARLEQRFPWGKISLRLNVVDGRIREAKIFGDFFSHDLGELESGLHGRRYDGLELMEALRPLTQLVRGASEKDLTVLAGLPL